MNLPRTYGRVKIHGKLIEENPELISQVVFQNCIVLRAEHMFIEDVMEYVIYSPDFDEVEQGYEMPEYMAQITQHKSDDDVVTYTRKWEKC